MTKRTTHATRSMPVRGAPVKAKSDTTAAEAVV